MLGGLGILEGSPHNWACIPLSIQNHDGLQVASEWKGVSVYSTSSVIKMVEDVYQVARILGGFSAFVGQVLSHSACSTKLGCLNESGTARM